MWSCYAQDLIKYRPNLEEPTPLAAVEYSGGLEPSRADTPVKVFFGECKHAGKDDSPIWRAGRFCGQLN